MKKLKLIDYNSPVILTFAGISLIALILSYLTLGYSNKLLFSVYRSSLANPLTYLRLFTHVLGHADFSHYISNMMFFLIVVSSEKVCLNRFVVLNRFTYFIKIITT